MKIKAQAVTVLLVILSILGVFGSTADARDMGKVLRSDARFVLTSSKPIFDVERCLINLDMPTMAFVYRAPDRPSESLVYWDLGMGPPLVAELVSSASGTSISVKGGRNAGRNHIESCVDSR